MSQLEVRDRDQSAISILFAFTVSVFIAVFAEQRLHGLGSLLSGLARHHEEGTLSSLGLTDLDLGSFALNLAIALGSFFWLIKVCKSPAGQVIAAIVGVTVGAWIGLHG